MIIDQLENAGRYVSQHPSFAKAFDYLRTTDLAAMQAGEYPIDDNLRASVSVRAGKTREGARREAHDQNIDIQVCIAGAEEMGWKPRADCGQPTAPYDAAKDVVFYPDAPDTYFSLRPGQFVIFFPEDVHAPMIGGGEIKKMVIKVKL